MAKNRDMVKVGVVVCEWNPWLDRPAMMGDPYHGEAQVVAGRLNKHSSRGDRQLRVCRDCSNRLTVQDAVRTPGKSPRFEEIDRREGGAL